MLLALIVVVVDVVLCCALFEQQHSCFFGLVCNEREWELEGICVGGREKMEVLTMTRGVCLNAAFEYV